MLIGVGTNSVAACSRLCHSATSHPCATARPADFIIRQAKAARNYKKHVAFVVVGEARHSVFGLRTIKTLRTKGLREGLMGLRCLGLLLRTCVATVSRFSFGQRLHALGVMLLHPHSASISWTSYD